MHPGIVFFVNIAVIIFLFYNANIIIIKEDSQAIIGFIIIIIFRFGNALDLNGARRKNATRETTAALKAWLYEHRKNPYPTKGEKIMLAIITKMTLTQVSQKMQIYYFCSVHCSHFPVFFSLLYGTVLQYTFILH